MIATIVYLLMAFSKQECCWMPSQLYKINGKMSFVDNSIFSLAGIYRLFNNRQLTPEMDQGARRQQFMISTSQEGGKIVVGSSEFYAACAMGGILSCGLTHLAVTPLDIVKCNMQIEPKKYKSISSSFKLILKDKGVKGLFKGWGPTFLGYSAQGACKFGFYEYFKIKYAEIVGPEFYNNYKAVVYITASASAEFIADIALCPFEAVKIRVQTTADPPGFARGFVDGFPKLLKNEGFGGLYKGVIPLWGRQIPYTMMKFSCFESTVEFLYKHVVITPKEKCSKSKQLGVSFAAGYIAGILCAIVSHPADNLVSVLNSKKAKSVGEAIKQMGYVALFTRGLPLRIFMIGTLTGAQWGIYDAFKVLVGLPTTGGASSPTIASKKH